MEHMKKVKNWLMSRKMGSTGSLLMGSVQDLTLMDPHHQSQYELTSIRVSHLLDKKLYQKVVDMLRELSRDHLLHCLESFPFNALNKAVPASFLIWETLLTKLKVSEEGYVPQIPYKSCDDLVMRVGWLMENNPKAEDLQHSCRRVLKCVYMQYNEVLEHLYKEHDRVNYALYTLSRHSPLGHNGPYSTLSLEQAIKEEIQASLADYSTVLECLDDLGNHQDPNKIGNESEDVQKLSPSSNCGSSENEEAESASKQIGSLQAPNPTPVQLHERLYKNQRVFTALQPSRRSDTLQQMMDQLKERILGDKEVLYLFKKIRSRESRVNKSTPVQPWLRKYEHALDLTINAIKDIEKDLEIIVPGAESPMQFGSGSTLTSDEGGMQVVPFGPGYNRPRSKSYETTTERPFLPHSILPTMGQTMTEEETITPPPPSTQSRHLSIPSTFRPRSASPSKLNRLKRNSSGSCAGKSLGVDMGNTHAESMKSINSSNGSSSGILGPRSSSSVHDLHTSQDQPTSLAFTRVQSLKTNKTVQVVAGKRKQLSITPTSLTSLTANSPSGSAIIYVGGGKKKKHSSASAEMSGDKLTQGELLMRQALQVKNEEVMSLQMQVQDLRKRERALMDRLSEQAQKHLLESEKFEDILLGNQRPTQVTQAYSELFSQARVEALEEIETIVSATPNVSGLNANFTSQLLLDVLTVSYTEASRALEELHLTWKSSLSVEDTPTDSVAVKQLEVAVGQYLRRVSTKHDTRAVAKSTLLQLSSRYPNGTVYRETCQKPQFCAYVCECASICWSLCVQTPPMALEYREEEFQAEKHCRLYNSNMNSSIILQYLWPTLVQKSSGTVLSQGWVST